MDIEIKTNIFEFFENKNDFLFNKREIQKFNENRYTTINKRIKIKFIFDDDNIVKIVAFYIKNVLIIRNMNSNNQKKCYGTESLEWLREQCKKQDLEIYVIDIKKESIGFRQKMLNKKLINGLILDGIKI